MRNRWQLTEEQNIRPISGISNLFIDELNVLQQELHYLDEFIDSFVETIRSRWSPNSCHAQIRKLKKENHNF